MTIDAVLVDTDVVSFLLKDDTRAQAYRPLLTSKTLVLSFMTVAELYQWAIICVERQRLGKPISVQDAWIAATAIRHNVPLATHNREDFAGISGLTLLT